MGVMPALEFFPDRLYCARPPPSLTASCTQAGESALDVTLFIPCYVDQLAPEVGMASVRVLERAGCHVETVACTDRYVNPLIEFALNLFPTRYVMFNSFLVARKRM